MKITREQLIKMIKEELGDPAGEAEAENKEKHEQLGRESLQALKKLTQSLT